MEKLQLPDDFKDFLRSLNANEVSYLLIGGYAVGYHGYPRATLDMDIWIQVDDENAARMVAALTSFGFAPGAVSKEIFLKTDRVFRLGVPPLQLEVLMEISGVEFDACFQRRLEAETEGIPVSMISLEDLRANKAASGRYKDLDDLKNLPLPFSQKTSFGSEP